MFYGIFCVLRKFPYFTEFSTFRFLWNFPRFMEFSMFCGSFRFPFFVEFSAFYGSFVWYNLIFPYLFRILWKFCIFLFISSAIFHAIYEIYDLADKKRVDFIVARHAFCITKYHLARGHPNTPNNITLVLEFSIKSGKLCSMQFFPYFTEVSIFPVPTNIKKPGTFFDMLLTFYEYFPNINYSQVILFPFIPQL